MQAVEVIKALHDASPSEVTRRGGKLCAEIVYADVHATTNKGRPRNLRKKHASEDEQGSADEHEMDSMRERIAAVRLKEKRRNENSTLSGGGEADRMWLCDGKTMLRPRSYTLKRSGDARARGVSEMHTMKSAHLSTLPLLLRQVTFAHGQVMDFCSGKLHSMQCGLTMLMAPPCAMMIRHPRSLNRHLRSQGTTRQ